MTVEPNFFYDSQSRVELLFESPNHCATILSIAAMLLLGGLIYSLRCRQYITSLFLAVVLGGLLWALVNTYSRGGWVSFLFGCLSLICFHKESRLFAASFVIAFILTVFVTPSGLKRVNSTAAFKQDLSIANRLTVWSGAAMITASEPLHGVGIDNFGKIYSAWYQPLAMKTRYLSAVNNYLTLSAEQGIVVLTIYLMLLLSPIVFGYYILSRSFNSVLMGTPAALLTYFLSGIFTFNFGFWHVTMAAALSYLGLIWYIGSFLKENHHLPIFQISLIAFGCSAAATVTILAAGYYNLYRSPTDITFRGGLSGPVVAVFPREQVPKYEVIVLSINDEDGEDIARNFLRPLAVEGIATLLLVLQKDERKALSEVKAEILSRKSDFLSRKVIVSGRGTGARLAALLACDGAMRDHVLGVVASDADLAWPFEDLSLVAQLENLHCPLVLSLNARIAARYHFELHAVKAKNDVKLKLEEPDFSPFETLRLNVLELIRRI